MEEQAKAGRINSKMTFGYEAINEEGVKTIELLPTTLIVRDQSQEDASAHLAAVAGGFMAPAVAQAQAQA